MEIKTSEDIFKQIQLYGYSNSTKKWVSVEDIVKALKELEPEHGSDVDYPYIYQLIKELNGDE